MKKYIKLVLPIFLLFVFTVNISAEDLVCNDGKSIKLKETSEASPTNYDAAVYKCDWNREGTDDIGGDSIDAIVNKAEQTYQKQVATRDAKGYATKTFTRCEPKASKVDISYKCTKDPDYYDCYTPNDCSGIEGCKPCSKGGSVVGNQCCFTKTYKNQGDSKTNQSVDRARKLEEEYNDEINNYKKQGYSCSMDITMHCPKYKCKPTPTIIGACTPTYKTEDGRDAYCVNPGNPFSKYGTTSAQFIEDKNFDVMSCNSSYSTIDCGYANILIEGEYNKLCYNAINLALRLWGAHAGQPGYTNKTGLSNAYTTDYKSCNNEIVYGYEGSGNNAYFINVYKKTLEYIENNFRSIADKVASEKEYIDPRNMIFKKITCSTSLLGVICERGSGNYSCSGSNATTSQTAFNLYFNTLLGNKYMKEHLLSMYHSDVDATPTSVEVVPSDSEGKSIVEIKFDKLSQSTEKGVVVDCDELIKHKDDPKYEKEVNEILPYCQVKVSIVDLDGNDIIDTAAIKECIKGDGCRTKEVKYAICDETKTYGEHVVVRTVYDKSVAVSSVKRYISCDAPDKNQILFSIYDEKTIIDDLDDPRVKKDRTVTTTQDFPISSYSCGGTCKDYNIRTNGSKCTKDSAYNKTYTSYYKDPSLSCIVNMGTSPEKQKYDYTSYLGLNSNICRVYCSDEVSYTMPTKVEVNSGLSFKYNIEFSEARREDKNILLSSVIKEKRRCVSEIYYSKPFPASSLTAIKKQYGLSDSEMSKVTNWTTLFSVLSTRSKDKEGARTENLKELIYDLYNCNAYKTNDIPVKKPKNKIIGVNGEKFNSSYDFIKYLYEEKNNYGVGKALVDGGLYERCELNSKNNTCITLSSIKYEAGAEVEGSGVTESDVKRVGEEENIDIGYVVGSNNIGDVKYCSGGACLVYTDLEHEKYDYDTFNTTSKTSTVIKEVTDNKIHSVDSIKIPTNDYAIFSVVTEVGAYNSSQFETYPYTGRVKKVTGKENIAKLDPYLYPVSKDAYSICGGSGKIHNCSVKQNIGNIQTFYRKYNTDALTNALNSNKSFECFYDVRKPSVVSPKEGEAYDLGEYTIFRNVNVESLFPSARTEESNWTTERGVEAKKNIEESASTIYTTDEYLEYSVTLNPAQSKAINTDYNNESYINDTIMENTCRLEDGKYFDCKSEFVDELMNSTAGDTSRYGEMDPNYKGTSKHNTK